ncbi:MAG: RNA methyltransferase [Cytophagaceae bacterium]|nr:RNA methyltransferase [Cytophagaceae bacterium]MDW8455267.1 TrmH family RNA methyltransferase [Cytophagaceae bacterium]
MTEGRKSVIEVLQSDYRVEVVFCNKSLADEINTYAKKRTIRVEEVSEAQLNEMSHFKHNNACMAIVEMKDNEKLKIEENEFLVLLDRISDPGNLGTIIRICDWYSINKIVCSNDTAEFYNPKVISASMGSFTRVRTYYTDLEEYLRSINVPVYGACLMGKNIHHIAFSSSGILIIGNESQGISKALSKYITEKISIPKYGGAESLNAAVATGIICDCIMSKVKK